jgi:hypothetical protein
LSNERLKLVTFPLHSRLWIAAAGALVAAMPLLPVSVATAASRTVTATAASRTVTVKHVSHAPAATRLGYLLGLLVALGLLAALAIGKGYFKRLANLFLGQDNRISTSKTIWAVWTIIVASAFFGAVFANLLNHPQALNAMATSGIVGQYAVLIGGPIGAAILAKQIVTSQVAVDPSNKTQGTPSARDLISNDSGGVDLGDLQYVLFNAAALFYVISTLLHAPLKGLPHIPDVLLGLTSVAAAGYVGKKALVPTDTVSAAVAQATSQGPAGTQVTIGLSGFPASRQVVRALVEFGDNDNGQAVHEPVADGGAALNVAAPDLQLAAKTSVNVKVATDDGMVLSAGKFTYT